ncbi:hypothetical protein GCM10010216_54320 [Streptomyces flaveolus]|nr:hypothetical protein GCM10010216_54320 [Streptomyces flaveolus]
MPVPDGQGVVAGSAGFCGEEHEALTGAVGADPGVAVEGEIAVDGVVIALGAYVALLTRRPQGARQWCNAGTVAVGGR